MTMATCTNVTNVSNVKIQEPKSRHAVFANPTNHDYKVTRFDGCVVVNALACDFVVEKCGVARVTVELKGSDIDHATKQIEATLQHLKAIGLTELKLGALIICTRVPAFDGTLQKNKARLARLHKVPLTVKQDGRNLKIEDLVA